MTKRPRIDSVMEITDKKPEECDVHDIKSKKKRQWLQAVYHSGGTVLGAERISGITSKSHYRWMKCPVYAHVFELQRQRSIDIYEDEAHRRAVDGIDEPVYQGKELVGYKNKKSDELLKTLMKHRDTSYRENQPTDKNLNQAVILNLNIPRPPKPVTIDVEGEPIPNQTDD